MHKKVVIEESWCKGCGICAAFCPKKCIQIVGGRAEFVRPNDCILCGLCEMRCPDYAIYLKEVSDDE